MAIRFKVNCLACNIIREEAGTKSPQSSKLYKLVEQNQLGAISLTDIHEIYKDKLSYVIVRNHGIKHQNVTEKRLMETKIKAVQGRKMAQLQVAQVNHQEFLDKVVSTVMEKLTSGEIENISVKDALQATKLHLDQEARGKDRELKVLEMVYGFASGELDQKAEKFAPAIDPNHRVVEGEIFSEGEIIE